MMLLASVNPFDFFKTSDLAGQVIFCILVVLSLLAWTTMIGKYLQLKRMRESNEAFASALASAAEVRDLDATLYVGCPYATMTAAATGAFGRAREMGVPPTDQMVHVANAIQRALNSASLVYESKMILLGSLVSGAPFLGLLGTVWGVMIAFGGIAMSSGAASIQALAPGVAAALVCTVTGLLVAIPAVFGYNFLLTQTKVLVTQLENFASALADRIELENKFGVTAPAAQPATVATTPTSTVNTLS
jgi:biopolymer transport protein TolQ